MKSHDCTGLSGSTIRLCVAARHASMCVHSTVLCDRRSRRMDGTDDGPLRWGVILSAAMVQVVAGAVYSMGAWQAPLRDGLGVSTEAISFVGATTFIGSVAAMLGGRAFDRLGPKTSVLLGGGLATCGYVLLALAL
eukprot:5880386-Prymnesium_polylepis.1